MNTDQLHNLPIYSSSSVILILNFYLIVWFKDLQHIFWNEHQNCEPSWSNDEIEVKNSVLNGNVQFWGDFNKNESMKSWSESSNYEDDFEEDNKDEEGESKS